MKYLLQVESKHSEGTDEDWFLFDTKEQLDKEVAACIEDNQIVWLESYEVHGEPTTLYVDKKYYPHYD